MRSFRRRDSVIDAAPVDESSSATPTDAGRAQVLAEEAEAEAAEAEATAAAAQARARALRLRREAEQAADVDETGGQTEPEAAEVEASEGAVEAVELDADDTADPAVKSRWRRLPRPTWKGIAATVVVLCTVALLTVSGYMIWNHRQAEKLQQQNAEFAAVTLMSLDFHQAQEDVERIIDSSTGGFKDDFEQQAADFVKVAQDSKVITEVTVNSTAVESMTDDSAVVLVAASSRVTNTSGANQEPRAWRLSVGMQRVDGQIKMAKVEFVP